MEKGLNRTRYSPPPPPIFSNLASLLQNSGFKRV